MTNAYNLLKDMSEIRGISARSLYRGQKYGGGNFPPATSGAAIAATRRLAQDEVLNVAE